MVGAGGAGLVLLGRGREERPAAAKRDGAAIGQIVLGFSQEPTVFNPHLMHIEVDEGVHYAVFDTLIRAAPSGVLQPSLAVEIPTIENGGVSEDGLNWRLRLRDKVTWHDGRPFTADDVRFTFELMVDPAFNAWRRAGYDLIRDIRVVSPTEISWRLIRPYAPLLSILATTFVLPRHGFEGATDKNKAPFNNAPVGTGPYRFARRVAGDRIEFAANKDYFGEGPHLNSFIIKYIPDMTVMYTQFVTGDIDVIGLSWIPADNYQDAMTLPGRHVEVMPSALIEAIAFNTTRPQLSDPAVRHALYHALDKDGIIQYLYYGLPQKTESYVPRQSLYYNAALTPHEFNLDKARRILDEAGWRPGRDGIRVKDGVRLSFVNSTTTGNQLREYVQQFFQQTLGRIGVEMRISNMPSAVLFGDFWMKGRFDSVLHGQEYLVGSDPDPSSFFHSTKAPAKGGPGMNFWQYANPEVDALLDRGETTLDLEERRRIYLRIQELVRQDLPFLPIYQRARVGGWKQGVEGVAANVNTRIDTWNVNTWRWA